MRKLRELANIILRPLSLSLELIVNGLLKSPTTDQRTIYVFEKAKKKDPQNFSWSP